MTTFAGKPLDVTVAARRKAVAGRAEQSFPQADIDSLGTGPNQSAQHMDFGEGEATPITATPAVGEQLAGMAPQMIYPAGLPDGDADDGTAAARKMAIAKRAEQNFPQGGIDSLGTGPGGEQAAQQMSGMDLSGEFDEKGRPYPDAGDASAESIKMPGLDSPMAKDAWLQSAVGGATPAPAIKPPTVTSRSTMGGVDVRPLRRAAIARQQSRAGRRPEES